MSDESKEEKPQKQIWRTGRPCILTLGTSEADGCIKDLLGYLTMGNYVDTSCVLAGISKDTFYDWIKKAHKVRKHLRQDSTYVPTVDEEATVAFSDAVKKAKAKSEVLDLKEIHDAGAKNWTARAWKLERRNPKRWGQKMQIEQTGTTLIQNVDIKLTAQEEAEFKGRMDKFFGKKGE